MNRKIITGSVITAFIAVFLYFSFQQVVPKEIENAPDWMPLETAIELAGESEKLILVDIYEIACRFCRHMEQEVYPSETIRALIDQSFYPVKVDGNSDNTLVYNGREMTEKDFAREMGVTAFPFTVILDSEGNVINSRRGYMGTADLSRFMNAALAMK